MALSTQIHRHKGKPFNFLWLDRRSRFTKQKRRKDESKKRIQTYTLRHLLLWNKHELWENLKGGGEGWRGCRAIFVTIQTPTSTLPLKSFRTLPIFRRPINLDTREEKKWLQKLAYSCFTIYEISVSISNKTVKKIKFKFAQCKL